MRLEFLATVCPAVALCACGPSRRDPPPQAAERHHHPAVRSVEEPSPSPQPASVEAATQVVQNYGALIEAKKWEQARSLWSDPKAARKLAAVLAQYSEVHMEVGNPREPEGAAGSLYVTVPAFFYANSKDGQPFRTSSNVILRRVNDVPGSTDAQRRWRIERIELAD